MSTGEHIGILTLKSLGGLSCSVDGMAQSVPRKITKFEWRVLDFEVQPLYWGE